MRMLAKMHQLCTKESLRNNSYEPADGELSPLTCSHCPKWTVYSISTTKSDQKIK